MMLKWFSKATSSKKFKYDISHSKYFDVQNILSIVTMSYMPNTKLYALDSNAFAAHGKFVCN